MLQVISGDTLGCCRNFVYRFFRRNCSDHTVVPFSIAIKRLSEIVVYKANHCVASLNTAAANVKCEMLQLDRNVDSVAEGLNASFQVSIKFTFFCRKFSNWKGKLAY